MNIRRIVSYMRRGHNLLIYIPWTLDKLLTMSIASVIILGLWMPLTTALSLGFFLSFLFLAVYFVSATLLGRWDYKKGSWASEATLMFQNNPQWQAMITKIDYLILRMEEYEK